eukprot:scaffold355770_cov45-Prasinocladus_malaysianus.AAC.1
MSTGTGLRQITGIMLKLENNDDLHSGGAMAARLRSHTFFSIMAVLPAMIASCTFDLGHGWRIMDWTRSS